MYVRCTLLHDAETAYSTCMHVPLRADNARVRCTLLHDPKMTYCTYMHARSAPCWQCKSQVYAPTRS